MAELWAELEALEREVRELQTRTEDLWRQRKATSSGPEEAPGGPGESLTQPRPHGLEVSHGNHR